MPAHTAAGYLYEMELLRESEGWNANEYPFNLPALRGWDRLRFDERVTFFVGENGSGKSTLIEAIAAAYGLNPEGGSRDHNFSTRATHSPLHEHIRLTRTAKRPKDSFFLRAESFYSLSSFIDDNGNPERLKFKKLHQLSHGQSFSTIFEDRFSGAGFYVLDEPEAALSPNRQLGFLSRLHELVAAQSQLIIATHSPIILAYLHAQIFEFREKGLEPVAYEDLEHVQVTKNFLNRRDTFLDILLSDDD